MDNTTKNISIRTLIGNAFEMYEYVLFGYLGPIIAKLFFNSPSPTIRLLEVFGIFASGYLMRPLGAIVFGHFSDRYGRKKVFVFSIILMAISTTAIGLLPTYAEIGIFSCFLLIICRLLQGFAFGGEFCGAMVYLLEYNQNHRGLYSGLIWVTGTIGFLLGSIACFFITNIADNESILDWGWRVPFILSLFMGLYGIYLSKRLPETPEFLNAKSAKILLNNPIKNILKNYRVNMFAIMGLVILPASAFFIFFVFMPSLIATQLNLPLNVAFKINTISLMLYIPIVPLAGFLSDVIGRKPVMLIGSIGFLLFAYPAFMLINYGTAASIITAQLVCGTLIACCYAPLPAVLVDSLPVNVRYSTISLPFNITIALSAFISPSIITLIINTSNSILDISAYVILLALIMLITTILFFKFLVKNETSHNKITNYGVSF